MTYNKPPSISTHLDHHRYLQSQSPSLLPKLPPSTNPSSLILHHYPRSPPISLLSLLPSPRLRLPSRDQASSLTGLSQCWQTAPQSSPSWTPSPTGSRGLNVCLFFQTDGQPCRVWSFPSLWSCSSQSERYATGVDVDPLPRLPIGGAPLANVLVSWPIYLVTLQCIHMNKQSKSSRTVVATQKSGFKNYRIQRSAPIATMLHMEIK